MKNPIIESISLAFMLVALVLLFNDLLVEGLLMLVVLGLINIHFIAEK